MVKAVISSGFEKSVVKICSGLKAVLDAGADLLAAIPKATDAIQSPDDDAFAELGARRLAYLIEKKSPYGELAVQVMRIGDAVDGERAIFAQRENPHPSDLFIGFFSKRSMRRRIEQRAAGIGGIERLRTVLGRADRLVGLIEVHRQAVIGQRKSADDALAALAARKASEFSGATSAEGHHIGTNAGKHDFERMIGLADPVARSFNGSVRDLNLLLQKLSLDTENLLDLYSVLLSFDREREAHYLSPDAYPHLTRQVWRLGNELLPGARLERSRQRTDIAFARRFEEA